MTSASRQRSDEQRRFRSAARFIASREFFGMKLGLENVAGFVESLGNPHASFPAVHIAGTNGKGSTVATLASVLRSAGYKTGVFTSPHLVDFRERIRINGQKIDRRFVGRFIERHRAEIRRRQITYFEVMVSLAVSYFARRGVDVAIFETGLGGRLDATNILNPLMCGISQISLDHTSILGATLPRIAREKGGIIKPGAPVALGVMPESARATLRGIARTQRAPRRKLVGERAAMRFARSLRLEGQCQVENLRLALTVVRELRRQGYRIPDRAIHRGLFRVRWRGRFQRLRSPAGATIILDVAHNESGLISVASTFRRLFPGRRARILIGLVKNKRHKNSLAPLKGIAEEFIFTRLPTRRTLEPAELKKALGGFPRRVTVPETPTRAFRYALSSLESDGRGGILLIAGSHYLVGDFLRRSLHRPKRIS